MSEDQSRIHTDLTMGVLVIVAAICIASIVLYIQIYGVNKEEVQRFSSSENPVTISLLDNTEGNKTASILPSAQPIGALAIIINQKIKLEKPTDEIKIWEIFFKNKTEDNLFLTMYDKDNKIIYDDIYPF